VADGKQEINLEWPYHSQKQRINTASRASGPLGSKQGSGAVSRLLSISQEF